MIFSPWAHVTPLCVPTTFKKIKDTCSSLGIPLVLEKIEEPSQHLTFLGITLDTELMQAHLPEDKLSRLRNQVKAWLSRKKAIKREILSLVGLLQHATKVIIPGRTFVSRMYKAAARLKKLFRSTMLTAGFRSDLRWWHLFASCSVQDSNPCYISLS